MSGPGMHLRRDRGDTPGCLVVAAASLIASAALLALTLLVKLAGLLPWR